MKNTLIFFVCLIFLLYGCIKQTKEKDEHFVLKVNGKVIRMGGATISGGGQFNCDIYGDTVLFIAAGTGESVVFYIKDSKISDGTYQLNNTNKAFYNRLSGSEYLKHQTTDIQPGTLTIKRSSYPLSAGTLKALDGTFSFTAIDSLNNKIVTITDGKFMMQRVEY